MENTEKSKTRISEHCYKIGEEINGLRIIEHTRKGKRNLKAYVVQSTTYKTAEPYIISEWELKKGTGDAYTCRSPKRICEENSLYSFKHLRPYIIDIEQAKIIAPNHMKAITFKCTCGKEKKMRPNTLVRNGLSCSNCSSNISYPERFFLAVNQYFSLNFEYQVIYEKGRFDFVNHDEKIIVEMNGEQHYVEREDSAWKDSYKNTIDSDNRKRQWCRDNGYTLIFIDASHSEFEFIRDNINKEELLPNIKDMDVEKILCLIEKYSKYDVKGIIKDYKEGMNQAQLGKKYNVDRGTIRNILKRNNIEIRENNKYSTLPIDSIIEEYQNGISAYKIADKYHVSSIVIYDILKRNNVSMRTPSETLKIQLPVNEIVDLYINKKMSTIKISDLYGVSNKTIARVLKDNNITLREASIGRERRVRCKDTGIIYKSSEEAKRQTGISHISCVCNGKRKTAGGYSWEYVDNESDIPKE